MTIAVDTNVVLRLLRQDDPEQGRRAVELFVGNQVFIPLTVILETEWVLRSGYKLQRREVVSALRAVIDLERVVVDRAEDVHAALSGLEQGMDFADALHLAQSEGCEAFFSFDRQLASRAGRLDRAMPIRHP